MNTILSLLMFLSRIARPVVLIPLSLTVEPEATNTVLPMHSFLGNRGSSVYLVVNENGITEDEGK